MRASVNRTKTKYGQVIESQIQLDGDLVTDMKDKFMIFKNVDTGLNLLRIKQTENQLYYNVFNEGDWSIDLPLTLSDPDQIFNLPQEPARVNSNTYARMDTDFKLFDQGSQYIRIVNDPPTILVGSSISFGLEEDEGPVATITSTGLNMNSNRITDLANPTAATDAVNRQFLEKFDVPIGVVLNYFGNSIPAGYLYCDGSTFVVGDYPELFTLLGGNILPDLRGQFLRGDSQSNAVDPSGPRAVGTVQQDELESHTHTGTTNDAWFAENQGLGQGRFGTNADTDTDNDLFTRTVNLSINSTGGAETRPKNVAVKFIIKAKIGRNI